MSAKSEISSHLGALRGPCSAAISPPDAFQERQRKTAPRAKQIQPSHSGKSPLAESCLPHSLSGRHTRAWPNAAKAAAPRKAARPDLDFTFAMGVRPEGERKIQIRKFHQIHLETRGFGRCLQPGTPDQV